MFRLGPGSGAAEDAPSDDLEQEVIHGSAHDGDRLAGRNPTAASREVLIDKATGDAPIQRSERDVLALQPATEVRCGANVSLDPALAVAATLQEPREVIENATDLTSAQALKDTWHLEELFQHHGSIRGHRGR